MEGQEKLKAGDIVRLKSGGPKMTVKWDEEGGAVTCTYFVLVSRGIYEAAPREAVFFSQSLRKETASDEGLA